MSRAVACDVDITNEKRGRNVRPRRMSWNDGSRLVTRIRALLLATSCEAVRAVDWLVPAGLERYLSLSTALIANRGIHLPFRAVRTAVAIRASATRRVAQRRISARLVGRPAGWAPAWPVSEPLLSVKALLSRCEDEITSAVTALQRDVGMFLHGTCTPWRWSSQCDDAQYHRVRLRTARLGVGRATLGHYHLCRIS